MESSPNICKTNKDIGINTIKNENDVLITDKKAIADEFNRTFAGMGKKLANKIEKNNNFNLTRSSHINSMVLLPTNTQEMQTLINELKNKKAVGLDDIKAEVLKSVSNYILNPLVYIGNRCMEDGVWPSAFKQTVVIPIYKKGDKNMVTNYRPISLITHLSKVFEKLIKRRLTTYINKFNLLSDSQYGFREKMSTEDALLTLTSKLYSTLNEGKPSLCVFLDLSKAFDTVSHELLLQSLEDIGIRSNCLKLFKSYIDNNMSEPAMH